MSFCRLVYACLFDHDKKDKVSKFGDKATEGIFLGYSVNSPSKRVFNKSTNRIEEHFEVKCLRYTEPPQGTGPAWFFKYDDLFNSFNLPEEDLVEEVVTLLHGMDIVNESSTSTPAPTSVPTPTPTPTHTPATTPTSILDCFNKTINLIF